MGFGLTSALRLRSLIHAALRRGEPFASKRCIELVEEGARGGIR